MFLRSGSRQQSPAKRGSHGLDDVIGIAHDVLLPGRGESGFLPVGSKLVQLDHLVVAAVNLAAGADWVEQRLGARPVIGGCHDAMGTHNLLLGLGPCYLEVIAVDPFAGRPGRPRWFGLDDFDGAPRLVHWVARVENIEEAARRSAEPLGAVTTAARGDLRWRITIRDDGHLPCDGVVPTLIEWDEMDAASRLPASGWSLESLEATHPDPARACRILRSLGATLEVICGDTAGLRATLRGPRGIAVIDGD